MKLEHQFKVQPQEYHRGYCPSYENTFMEAERYAMRMADITGFAWVVITNNTIIETVW